MHTIESETRRVLKHWGRGEFKCIQYETEQVFIKPTNGWSEEHRIALESFLQERFEDRRILVSHISG